LKLVSFRCGQGFHLFAPRFAVWRHYASGAAVAQRLRPRRRLSTADSVLIPQQRSGFDFAPGSGNDLAMFVATISP
jgi:hypothetical protein